MITAEAFDRSLRAAAGQRWLWALLVATLAGWPIVHALRTRLPPQPPVLGAVPSFQLLDERGRPFGSADLGGRVWVASFVGTSCEGACADVARQLARIQARTRSLEPALHLVSFTVEPEHDTPARLAAYARAHRASPRMWTFLTGPADAVRAAVEQGLGASPGHRPADPSHGARLVLVDGASRIRGAYAPGEPGVVDRVVRDAALLVNRR